MREAWVLLVVSLTVLMLAQEKAPITVKETRSASGVTIVTVDLNSKSVDLQCTENMPACAGLKSGKYVMVQRIGEYCIIQK